MLAVVYYQIVFISLIDVEQHCHVLMKRRWIVSRQERMFLSRESNEIFP